MKLSDLSIGDLIRIPEVQTVMRLEADEALVANASSSFIITSDVEAHLHQLVESMRLPHGKGFFLQGDFGSGKSHFLTALYGFFSRVSGYEQLCKRHASLQEFNKLGTIIFPLALSLVHYRSESALEQILLEAIETALQHSGHRVILTKRGALLSVLRQSCNNPTIAGEIADSTGIDVDKLPLWITEHPGEAATLAEKLLDKYGLACEKPPALERRELFEKAVSEVLRAGYNGCILLIDELSEFFRSKSNASQLNEDARTLQLLGELSGTLPLWIIAALQESVERTGDIAQATFRKIKDRFPVKFHLSTLHIRDLIRKRLIEITDSGQETIPRIYEEYRKHFPGFTTGPSLFQSIYPVHPVTLELLEGLGDLFSQHRGIVDFIHAQLAGDPSRGIDGVLQRSCTELLAPDAIYNHFRTRIAEFSSFYVYPSQIIPHLDSVTENVLDDPTDRQLAKRLIRIIVLYTIHPTEEPPTAGKLAELVACMLSFDTPDVNIQYVSEVLLDPIVEKSRFLVKKTTATDTVYTITTSEDQGKILQARIDRITGETDADDTRLFIGALTELPESYSWPGPMIWNDTIQRTITWRQSLRTAAVAVACPGQAETVAARCDAQISSGSADFALIIALGGCSPACNHTAVWSIDFSDGDNHLLTEFFALKTVMGELRPGNPADIPLIPLVKDRLQRIAPAVAGTLLQRVYQGSFADETLVVDPAARQVMRFERLLEIAGEQICETRYPQFKEIAPRGLPPSLRLYQRLYSEFITAGSLPLREARARSLTESIETLAAPLGLVEVKGGSYLLSPQPSKNSFLAYLFGHLNVSGTRPRSEIMNELRYGSYGVPHDMACFVLASLAQCGLISLVNNGRTLPPEFIKLLTIDEVETIAPGELVNQADRETILTECTFLLPPDDQKTFDLRRQRDAWAAAIKFKASFTATLDSLSSQLQNVSGYSAFSNFDFERISSISGRLREVLDEIKVSYGPREGLERFTAAWRTSSLSYDEVSLVRDVNRFLKRHADRVVFVNHYCNHPSVVAAAEADEETAATRTMVIRLLKNTGLLLTDDGEELQRVFEQFREVYGNCYSSAHDRYYSTMVQPPLSKRNERNGTIIRKLSSLPTLDRPPGTRQFLAACDAPKPQKCMRNLNEELLRSATCSCNFIYGTLQPSPFTEDPSQTIERILNDYCDILKSKSVLESIAAHSFALRDIDPPTAKRLEDLHALLQNPKKQTVAPIVDLLDDITIAAIEKALSGYARIERRKLDELQTSLAGRRLNPTRIRSIMENWIGHTDGDIILSIEENTPSTASTSVVPDLWPQLHPRLFDDQSFKKAIHNSNFLHLSEMLEQLFPVADLLPVFNDASSQTLLEFITDEPAHLNAQAAAWRILIGHVLDGKVTLPDNMPKVRCLDKKEGAKITERLQMLQNITTLSDAPFPYRLQQRLLLSTLQNDSWTDAATTRSIHFYLNDIIGTGTDWFSLLPSVAPVDLSKPVTVVVVDAIPVDVWLSLLTDHSGLFSSAKHQWFRQVVSSSTLSGLNELFGFPEKSDPQNELTSRSVPYTTIDGDEEHAWIDMIPDMKNSLSQVVRVSLFDRGVHVGTFNLSGLAEKLPVLLMRHLPELIKQCKKNKRHLVLTTDHGLSLSEKGLHHGSGGLYEQTIFRATWQ